MDSVVCKCPGITEDDLAILRKLDSDAPIVSDVSRGDVFVYGLLSRSRVVVLARHQPHSISAIPSESTTGTEFAEEQAPLVFRTYHRGRPYHGMALTLTGAPILQEAYPIRGQDGRPVAVLAIETNLIEHERHLKRRSAFRQSLRQLQELFVRGALAGADALSPFGEHDGVLIVDGALRIRYISGVATNLYRRLGYVENMVGRKLSTMTTGDADLAQRALVERRCIESEQREGLRHWDRKAIPLVTSGALAGGMRRYRGLLPAGRVSSVMILVHDATAARRAEQDSKVRETMIQEVHHRVKNNLQSVASLLRLQARRSVSTEARTALSDSVNRILSIAVVHEFLSEHSSNSINIREMAQRIISQVLQSAVGSEKRIQATVEGTSIYLTNQQATSCSLVLNELLLNSAEHGFQGRDEGSIQVSLRDDGDRVTIAVTDDGAGLPIEFGADGEDSLGLTIVRTLVENDLKGEFDIRSAQGTCATITFPKATLGGGDSWSEPE